MIRLAISRHRKRKGRGDVPIKKLERGHCRAEWILDASGGACGGLAPAAGYVTRHVAYHI